MATDILESLRSDVRREPLLCLAAAQEIDSMRAELDRAKRDASFWRMIACALQNENRHSYANHG